MKLPINIRTSLLRILLLAFLVFGINIPAFPMNDFWLGCRYSVNVSFVVLDEKGIDPPTLQRCTMPAYPISLFRASVQGEAEVQFKVSETGEIVDVVVLHATADEFGKEAELAVKQWCFFPGKIRSDRSSVPVRMRCRFMFQIEEVPPQKPDSAKPNGLVPNS